MDLFCNQKGSLYDLLRVIVGGFFVLFFLVSLTGLTFTGFVVENVSDYTSKPEASLLMLSILGFFVLFLTKRNN